MNVQPIGALNPTYDQAMTMVDTALGAVEASRQSHALLQQAMNVIHETVMHLRQEVAMLQQKADAPASPNSVPQATAAPALVGDLAVSSSVPREDHE